MKLVSLIKKHSITILTGLSVAGVITTAVTSAIAADKSAKGKGHSRNSNRDYNEKSITNIAYEVLEGKWGKGTDREKKLTEAGYNYKEVQKKANSIISSTKQYSFKDKCVAYIRNNWKNYLVPVGVGTITSMCIIETHTLNKKQSAALVSAYMLASNSIKEYRRAVEKELGEDTDILIRNSIAKEKLPSDIELEEDELLFFDEISGRYFNSTMEKVKDAEYHFNRNFILRGCAFLNELYEFLGIPETEYGDTVGWCEDAEPDYGYRWVDFYHEKVTTDDGLECYIIRMPFPPHSDHLYM